MDSHISFWQNLVFTLQIGDHFFLNVDSSLQNPRLCSREVTIDGWLAYFTWKTGGFSFRWEHYYLFYYCGQKMWDFQPWRGGKYCIPIHSLTYVLSAVIWRIYTVLYCACTFRDSLRNTYSVLKGTVTWNRFQKFWQKFTEPGLTKGRSWFLNFLGAPMIL